MTESPGDRLRTARLRAGFPSASAAARAFRFHPQNLRDHEAGRRRISPEHATRYARAFGVTAGWLLYGQASGGKTSGGASGADGSGDAADAPTAGRPIVGRVGSGGFVSREGEDMGDAPRPPEDSERVNVLRVEGDAMWPAYGDGDLIYFDAPIADPEEIRALLVGRECVARLKDGREVLRRLEPGRTSDRFTLTSYNAPPLRDVALVSAAPVVWVRKAGS